MSLSAFDIGAFKYTVTHVFCPLQLPDEDDYSARNDRFLVGAVASAAALYSDYIGEAGLSRWQSISRMLDNLRSTLQFETLDRFQTVSQLNSMHAGDVLAYLIRAQNAAVRFRKQKDVTVFESFEVSPRAEDVMSAEGKLICSYPGPAIEIPNAVFETEGFISELVNFLARMNGDVLDAAPTSRKAHTTVIETRDTANPRYVTELLTGILRGVGRSADIARITKRVGDDVVWNNSRLPWRRSSIWLLIRVAVQTSLDRSTLGHDTYKEFMLFFMCRLANDKVCADLPNDTLQVVSAKISRRLRKLGSSAPDWLSRVVSQTCTSLRQTLDKRWTETQVVQRTSPLWAPSQLDLAGDIQLSLLNSGHYLRNCLAAHNISPLDTSFAPKHLHRGTLDDFLSSDGAFFEEAYRSEPYVALFDVEQAVEQGIDVWVDQVKDNDDACVKLKILADKYASSALETYLDNPELLSVMLLTTIELWIALDKIAIREIPMLADYSPEVPIGLLDRLLSRKASGLRRLSDAHRYLSRRHSRSNSGWSAFAPVTLNSFPIRFYRGSPHLQNLKDRIEEAAREEVRAKLAELEQAKVRQAELRNRAAVSNHDFSTNRYGNEYHAYYCTKCSLEREASSMQISVHEWPLPAEQVEAEAVVFELDCPISFNMWRSATLHLLTDLCSPPVETRTPYIQLPSYAALQPYLVQHSGSRVTLGSDTKPFVVTHYSTTSISSAPERVCVANGLTFYGFDTHARIVVSGALGPFDINRYCTYQLPDGPYEALQQYVDGVSHSSNHVMANQADCHEGLLIHEFIAFGHLRSGGLLQWLNVVRELRGRSLSFRRHEVHFLLAQAVSQVGPLDDAKWRWHQELRQPSFCCALLEELECLVGDVEANWLEGVTMDTVSFFLRRLLASSPDQAITLRAVGLLRTVRSKVFSWIEELSKKLAETPGDVEFSRFLRDTAAICRGTYDVDDAAVISELLHTAEDVKVLLVSAILVHDHTPSKIASLPAYSRLLLDRDRRPSLALEGVVTDVVRWQASSSLSDQGIDLAVRWVWPSYRAGSKWSPLENPNSRWFSCTTTPSAEQSSQAVYFNLLDGSLLVDGKPLGRLPSEILKHPLYGLIFGQHVLDVIPSDRPGMDYSTRGTVSGHQVYFSLRNNGSDLVIQAKRGDSRIVMELVPQVKLVGDLPDVLVEGHAHWLNLSTSTMEIRPLDHLWETSPENWTVACTPGMYRIQKRDKFLVDIRSRSWDMVSNLLRPLDAPQNLLVCVSPINSGLPASSLQLTVALPRYDLSFYVDDDGDLQCHSIRGMIYDEDQSVGTLFGLVNRLVLRPKIKDVDAIELVPRCVLIPEGKVAFQKDGDHVRVEIETRRSALDTVTYHAYKIDTELGCLTGNVGLTNMFYCAYLHALTSGCGTDPLTGRSGTEEALSLLRSAGCWSVVKFGSREEELLALIASLCPARTWYPAHLRCMQTVEWLDLPASSQHHELYAVAKGIKEHFERVQSFQEKRSDPVFEDFPVWDDHLLQRSARRTAHLFSPEFSGRPSMANSDVLYPARDVVEVASGEQRACTAATTVYRRTAHAETKINILSMVESWAGSVSGDATVSLQYDSSWLAPDLPLIWLKAYKLLQGNDERKWFQLLFSLPAMAYASPALANLVPVLVAFASDLRFLSEKSPPYLSYNLAEGYCLSWSTLREYTPECAYSFEYSPESAVPAEIGESATDLQKRRFRMYSNRREADKNATVSRLWNAWPCETPPTCSLDPKLYDVSAFTAKANGHFSSRFHNLQLREHFARVQEILNDAYNRASWISTPPQYSFQPSQSAPPRASWLLTVDELLTSRPAPQLQECGRLAAYASNDTGNVPPSASESIALRQLLTTAEQAVTDPFQRGYVSALRTSAEYLTSDPSLLCHGETELPTLEMLVAHYARSRASYIKARDHVRQHLGPRSQSEQALERSGQWPRITPYALFRLLASNSPIVLSSDWKDTLIRLALFALELQRAGRSLRLHLAGLYEELRRELQNEGCNGWKAETHPDWLLIQLQSNLLVRPVQANVAAEMISPHSGNNTAMQLNMGEGKSSVIVPIVVSVLADGTQLVRVIVPKALTAQMFNLLVDRLGGLVNRRIYFIPFSRSLDLSDEKVVVLREVISECMKERGILVVQPEHILSLKLISVEKQLSRTDDGNLAKQLLDLQKWLQSHSRDILDESDEILHVRYQLVYTIGDQQHMEGFPDRWTTTEQVLALVDKHASSLHDIYPRAVEYERGQSGSFPHLRILRVEAGKRLISWIVQDIMNGLLPNFNLGQLRSCYRDAVQSFISCENVHLSTVRLVKDYAQQTPLWNGLLLLRGLLASGIVLFAFRERRWRVDYGLALTRTMLAVPYRAKDVPAQRAEFGHPDIAVVLTCLSYYYGGLDEKQLRLSFEILLKQDDPSLDYGLWVREGGIVPECLRTINGINIKSSEQWNQHLFPLFSRNRATVNFYLSSVVFPKEAKEFPSKLSCSGWDLAERKERVLTGFSGTNDGQYLLPLHITQRDPDHQRGTNAKVLSYVLQPENRHYMCMSYDNGERRKTREFLEILVAQEPEIRVLLDVGAQMLDLRNHELAKEWLAISTNTSISAAIYFNEDDELTVLARDGRTHLLISSPFAQQLDQCIVYLDDAHTRGTDIKFPTKFRAAVTLGPKVTKDRLAQGCMRMRKLGHGHSVMFFAPLEIDQRIRSVAGKGPLDVVDTMDVLQWAIRETCDDIQQRASHWAQQGVDHASRYAIWTSFCRDELPSGEASEISRWLQPEAKRLEDLYGPHDTCDSALLANPDIRQRCAELGISSLRDVNMDEEQEREVVHEAERERQVERPPRATPATHSVHQDVVTFTKTGVVPTNSKAFHRAFETLNETSAAANEAHIWNPCLLVTTDFLRTVDLSNKPDDYLRPVMWVVSGKRAHHEALVILSPHEADHLLPDIRRSGKVHLHVYTPRTTESMKPCDDLDLYNIPMVPTGWTPSSSLMDQLNMFAGQLYLKDYDTYIRLCRFLCVYARDLEVEGGVEAGCDGFISPNHRPQHLRSVYSFQTTPLHSLRQLVALRRKGMQFAPTHVGKLLDGRLLSKEDFNSDHDEGLCKRTSPWYSRPTGFTCLYTAGCECVGIIRHWGGGGDDNPPLTEIDMSESSAAHNPFSVRRRQRLDNFFHAAWGHPEKFFKTFDSTDAGPFAFIDLGDHYDAVKLLLPLLRDRTLLVREEYLVALEALQSPYYTAPVAYRSDSPGHAYVVGQPGIGKTYFLVYLIVYFLGKGNVFALQLPGTYALFSEGGIQILSTENTDPLDDQPSSIWVLSDSDESIMIPAREFFSSRSARVIQTTSPKSSQWKGWSIQNGARRYVMDIWSKEEVKKLAVLFNLDHERVTEIAKKWGRVPRTFLTYYSEHDDDITVDHRDQAETAVREGGRMLQMGKLCDLPDEAPSSFYFIRPREATQRHLRPRVVVPTRTLCCILAEQLKFEDRAVVLQFLNALSGASQTRAAAGYVFECWVHSFMSAENQQINCQWVTGTHGLSGKIPSTPNVISVTDPEPDSWATPFYWIPKQPTFPGIDSALVTASDIFAMQITIAKKHTVKTLMKGLERLRNILPTHLKGLRWNVVYIGIDEDDVRRHAQDVGKVFFPTGEIPVPVGWSVVDPFKEQIMFRAFHQHFDLPENPVEEDSDSEESITVERESPSVSLAKSPGTKLGKADDNFDDGDHGPVASGSRVQLKRKRPDDERQHIIEPENGSSLTSLPGPSSKSKGKQHEKFGDSAHGAEVSGSRVPAKSKLKHKRKYS